MNEEKRSMGYNKLRNVKENGKCTKRKWHSVIFLHFIYLMMLTERNSMTQVGSRKSFYLFFFFFGVILNIYSRSSMPNVLWCYRVLHAHVFFKRTLELNRRSVRCYYCVFRYWYYVYWKFDVWDRDRHALICFNRTSLMVVCFFFSCNGGGGGSNEYYYMNWTHLIYNINFMFASFTKWHENKMIKKICTKYVVRYTQIHLFIHSNTVFSTSKNIFFFFFELYLFPIKSTYEF